MKLCIRILTGLLLTGIPQHLYACGTVYGSPAVTVQKIEAVTPVVVATFVPVTVAVPQYSVSYVGGTAYAAPSAMNQGPTAQATGQDTTAQPKAAGVDPQVQGLRDQVARLQKELDDCRKQLNPVLPKGEPEAAVAPPTIPPYLAIFNARCATCHEAKVASGKGGSFVLLKGDQLAGLDPRQVNRVLTQVYTGKMPKGGPALSDNEVSQIIAWVDSLK